MGKWKRAIIICAALGWWGYIYPQFTMVKGTYEIAVENVEAYEEEVTDFETAGRDIYWEIMNADRSQIRFKSRLLTEFRSLYGRWQSQRRLAYESGK